jgi:multidrug resistance protein MdtO
MASIAQPFPNTRARNLWLWDFLKEELAPYQGRGTLVARAVTASTIMMVLSMVFRLPFGAFGAIFGYIMSHEPNLEELGVHVANMVVGLAAGGAYVILGLSLTLGEPVLRFVWISGGFFIAFWAMSALKYSAAGRFGYLLAITITLYDQPLSPAAKVEQALWAVGVILLASVVAMLVSIVFSVFQKSNALTDAISERLACVEELLAAYASGNAVDEPSRATLTRLAMTGTSRLRQIVHHSGGDSQYLAQMGAVVSLTGRLVDLAANLPLFTGRVSEEVRDRIKTFTVRIREIRQALADGSVPQASEFTGPAESQFNVPLLNEIQQTVWLIYDAFTGSERLGVFAPSSEGAAASRSFLPSGLWDSEHFKYALRGGLAATSAYIIFNALFWPEISTAVTTCVLTALTTIGASHQKQILRITGAFIGGFGIAMGAQIFILPYLDSIFGFTVLYIVVIGISTWLSTSSPRLSYFGNQLAVAYCLIHLQEFHLQTSLAVARDRVVGILLGLFVMWLFYDTFWSAAAGSEMRKTFVSALRMLADLARGPVSGDLRASIEHSYVLREKINAQFDKVRSLADGVLFEFGESRRADLEFRDRLRRWQPQLRALFVMRIAALKYRLEAPGFEMPQAVALRQQAYDEASAQVLEDLANRIEGHVPSSAEEDRRVLQQTLGDAEAEAGRELQPDRAQSFIVLLHGIDKLTSSLAADIATEVR